DYVWPEMMFKRARSIIAALGADVVGEEFLPWGLRDFGRLLNVVRRSGASTLVLALPGPDGLHLLEQAERRGVLEGRTVADLGINEALLSTLPPGRAEGLFCSVPMVMNSPEPRVRDFVARILRRAGPSTTVDAFTLTHYNAVIACASVLRAAGTITREALTAGLRGLTIDSPTGPVTIGPDHHVTLSVYLAQRVAGRLAVIRALGRVAPESTC
ncbi:MAG: ABC transporter substrate-binding protein, partial [Gammaproteobacteria bacterium]